MEMDAKRMKLNEETETNRHAAKLAELEVERIREERLAMESKKALELQESQINLQKQMLEILNIVLHKQ
jgi:hypothetical protein